VYIQAAEEIIKNGL